MKYGELKRKNEEEILKLQEYDCGEGGMLPLLYFPLLDETGIVKNAFTTREGGVSKGIFESLNLSFKGELPQDCSCLWQGGDGYCLFGSDAHNECSACGWFVWRIRNYEGTSLHRCGWTCDR